MFFLFQLILLPNRPSLQESKDQPSPLDPIQSPQESKGQPSPLEIKSPQESKDQLSPQEIENERDVAAAKIEVKEVKVSFDCLLCYRSDYKEFP